MLVNMFHAVTIDWTRGGRRLRRRVMSMFWHEIVVHAQTDQQAELTLDQPDALRAWLEQRTDSPCSPRASRDARSSPTAPPAP